MTRPRRNSCWTRPAGRWAPTACARRTAAISCCPPTSPCPSRRTRRRCSSWPSSGRASASSSTCCRATRAAAPWTRWTPTRPACFVDLSAKLAYDEAKAKQLLDEAGWTLGANGLRQKDGRDFVLSPYESLPQPQNKETLQLVAQQWARIGVKLNVLSGDAGSRAVDTLDPDKTGVLRGPVGQAGL